MNKNDPADIYCVLTYNTSSNYPVMQSKTYNLMSSNRLTTMLLNRVLKLLKGGDPAAPSGTATLL